LQATLEVAKEIITLDHVSGGRVIAGFGLDVASQ
jgi:alkanesulfonate monooxygenase SsuD/methylene tetrahydromethanopterin reductase-like flavin-dependent oxidoreductase (luciferase family)